ncbi:MAG TPA: carbohydrate kinase [Thermomicrobiales bacterium]|nr:carbohydrate kinase [Thermomicrobiales bacterium]
MSEQVRPVISIGECLVDLIVGPGHDLSDASTLNVREGGAPMNFAVALARLGVASAMCAVVGDDPFGDRLIALLDREGVDVSGIRKTADAETTIAYAWRDERGDGRFRLVRMADRLLSGEDIARLPIGGAAAIQICSISLSAQPSRGATEDAIEVANRLGIPVIFDVNVRATLWLDRASLGEACLPRMARATVLKLSLDDADALWGFTSIDDVQRVLDAFDAPIVALTDGARATWIRRGGDWSRHDVFPVEAIEPTGAGDAFGAALVSRLLLRDPADWTNLGDAEIRFAMAAGAIATTKPGALPALPTVPEIEAFVVARST